MSTTLIDKAKLALESLVTLARNVASGSTLLVSKEETDARLDICKTCPELENEQNQMQCKNCGCFMRAKAQINGTRCPLNKW